MSASHGDPQYVILSSTWTHTHRTLQNKYSCPFIYLLQPKSLSELVSRSLHTAFETLRGAHRDFSCSMASEGSSATTWVGHTRQRITAVSRTRVERACAVNPPVLLGGAFRHYCFQFVRQNKTSCGHHTAPFQVWPTALCLEQDAVAHWAFKEGEKENKGKQNSMNMRQKWCKWVNKEAQLHVDWHCSLMFTLVGSLWRFPLGNSHMRDVANFCDLPTCFKISACSNSR